MNSRERVLKAMNHQEPDRVPVDFGGHRSSGIAAIAYARLRKYLGLEERPIRVYDPIQQLAIIDEDVLELFHVDTIELGRAFAQEDEHWVEWTLPDGTPCFMPRWAAPERVEDGWVLKNRNGIVVGIMPDGALYFDQCRWPFMEQEDLERLPEALEETIWCGIASPPGPLIEGEEGERIFVEGAKRLRQQTDKAILGLFGGNLLEIGQFLYRNDNFLMMLAAEPERVHRVLDRLVELHLKNLKWFLGLVGDYIDIIVFGDDLGMQHGPQISPKMYEEFFKPRHALLWRTAKELADVKVMLHSCGSIKPLIPHLIEAGLDAVNPVQISGADMAPEELKQRFGEQLTFWGGGCDTHNVLTHGSPQQVRDHVRELVEIFKPGGGFVFQQVHNILTDVPPENIVAMFEAVHEFGGY